MKTIKTPATIEKLEELIEFVIIELKHIGIDKKMENQMRLVCEEAFINVINYAYGEDTGMIEIDFDYNEEAKEFMIRMIDEGVEFDPLQKEDPDITLPMEKRKIGGLGIFMVKNIMDNVAYERKDGKNIFTMKKNMNREVYANEK